MSTLDNYFLSYPEDKDKICNDNKLISDHRTSISSVIIVSEVDDERIMILKIMILIFDYCFHRIKLGQSVKFRSLSPFFTYILKLDAEIYEYHEKTLQNLKTAEAGLGESNEVDTRWKTHMQNITFFSSQKRERLEDWNVVVLVLYFMIHCEIPT